MAECKELQALGIITTEVDESHVKIILSSQCIKAQVFLVDRLKKETERQKGVCKQISSGNFKLEAEIKHAELELKSMTTACDTIKSVNIEIKKETLLAKEMKLETIKRIKEGKKKYEDLWVQCKKRYESIPYVQKWFSATSITQGIKEQITCLDQSARKLHHEIKIKKADVYDKDRRSIVTLAEFMVRERLQLVQSIEENAKRLKELSAKYNEMVKHEAAKSSTTVVPLRDSGKQANSLVLEDGDWPSLRENFNNDDSEILIMPKHKYTSSDLDAFAVNLDQLKKVKTSHITLENKIENKPETIRKTDGKDDYISSFFNKSYLTSEDNDGGKDVEHKSFSQRKLINILDDIKIDNQDAQEIFTAADPHTMQPVNTIGNNEMGDNDGIEDNMNMETDDHPIVEKQNPVPSEHIEEVDMTANELEDDILIPPTLFSDSSQSKVSLSMKKVSFGLPVIEELPEETEASDVAVDDPEISATADSQINLSIVSSESYSTMKEMMLKKHNLDLSPDFIYARNNIGRQESKIVRSKFFTNTNANKVNIAEVPNPETEQQHQEPREIVVGENEKRDETDNDTMPKIIPYDDPQSVQDNKAVSGFLFTHGPSGIPESLDVSMNTTGYEDAEVDYPHCLDSSLLLSPKASMPVANDNAVVYSQEVPNFLSGLRKTGFSFFGASSTDPKPDSSGSQGSNFSFNFGGGGDDKKSRGGLFSMFN